MLYYTHNFASQVVQLRKFDTHSSFAIDDICISSLLVLQNALLFYLYTLYVYFIVQSQLPITP